MKLKYWTGFSKRKNSTKIPTATATEIDVWWKEDTPIDAPSVVLATNAINIDYVYINDFGKYYTVSSIIKLTDGTTQYDLKEDVLATHKTEIGNTVAHIARSSSGYDTMMIDSMLPIKSTKLISKASYDPSIFSSNGCFVLSITNVKASANGFAASYICSYNILENVANVLMNMDISSMVIKSIYRPFDCVISCTWLPIKLATATANCTSEEIYFGDYNSHISGYRLTTPTISNIGSVTVTPTYTDFRMVPPYTTYSLMMPFYGLVDLNASDIRNMIQLGSVSIGWNLDLASGDMTVGIYTGASIIGQTFNYNIGVNCPIAQTSNNMTGTIASIGGTVGGLIGTGISIATGNVPGAVLSGSAVLGSATSAALSYNTRSTSIKGGINGRSVAALGGEFVLSEYAMETADPDDASYIATYGRPVGLAHAINNHSGFVQCENASVTIAGDDFEREEINSFLNGGFYYE